MKKSIFKRTAFHIATLVVISSGLFAPKALAQMQWEHLQAQWDCQDAGLLNVDALILAGDIPLVSQQKAHGAFGADFLKNSEILELLGNDWSMQGTGWTPNDVVYGTPDGRVISTGEGIFAYHNSHASFYEAAAWNTFDFGQWWKQEPVLTEVPALGGFTVDDAMEMVQPFLTALEVPLGAPYRIEVWNAAAQKESYAKSQRVRDMYDGIDWAQVHEGYRIFYPVLINNVRICPDGIEEMDSETYFAGRPFVEVFVTAQELVYLVANDCPAINAEENPTDQPVLPYTQAVEHYCQNLADLIGVSMDGRKITKVALQYAVRGSYIPNDGKRYVIMPIWTFYFIDEKAWADMESYYPKLLIHTEFVDAIDAITGEPVGW